MARFDYLVVGAGFSGMVLAERLSSIGKSCLIIDRRPHIGGNCFDKPDANGVLYHVYGPHYFRTNNMRVKDYMSRFTDWADSRYLVRVMSAGKLWSFPINLATYEAFIGRAATEEEFKAFLANLPQPANIENSRDVMISMVGKTFFEMFYAEYTRKQWGRPAESLDASVTKRIPVRTNRDDRYFSDAFQALPRHGYTAVFNRIWETTQKQCPESRMEFSTHWHEVKAEYDHLIYTGPLDEYFDQKLGPLPYRSLKFNLEMKGPEELTNGFYQPFLQINYAGQEPFTRTVEVKHVTGQKSAFSNIVREFPESYTLGVNEPYYPIPSPDAHALCDAYMALARAETKTTFIGRLALYKYMNMDQIIGEALKKADEFMGSGSN